MSKVIAKSSLIIASALFCISAKASESKKLLIETIPKEWSWIASGTQTDVYTATTADGIELVLKIFKNPKEVISKYSEYNSDVELCKMNHIQKEFKSEIQKYTEEIKNEDEHKKTQLMNLKVAQLLIDKNAKSLKLAWKHLQKETKMLMLHLEKEKNQPKTMIKLIKNGTSKTVNLQETKFYIQEKHLLLKDYINNVRHDEKEVKMALDIFLEAQKNLWRKGFHDFDVHSPHTNYVVCHFKNSFEIFCIDPGQIRPTNTEEFEKHIRDNKNNLRKLRVRGFTGFLKDLGKLEYFEEKLQELYNEKIN